MFFEEKEKKRTRNKTNRSAPEIGIVLVHFDMKRKKRTGKERKASHYRGASKTKVRFPSLFLLDLLLLLLGHDGDGLFKGEVHRNPVLPACIHPGATQGERHS